VAYGAGAHRFAANPLRTLVLVAVAAAILAYLFVSPPALTRGGIDFSAFYCASRALSDGANPYRYEPLHTCEHGVRAWPRRADVVTAPLPPYALALLTPIARLPYPQASLLWFALLVASAGVMVWAVLEFTQLPLLVVGGPIAVAVLLQSLPTGSLAPVTLALLCAAAVALSRKRWTTTAVLVGFACLEPHVALPVLLALVVLVPEMRRRLALVVAALLALSVIAGGLALNAEYFRVVLPGHARIELGSIVQFSLSSMLYNFGVSDRTALALGSLQYALFVAGGVWLAHALRRFGPATAVLVPMALAVTGGVYIHLTQLAAVLPLAFVIAARTRSLLAWTGIALIAVPWNLLEAFTPATLTVPRLSEVIARVLERQGTAGEVAYLANALVYAGIACVFAGGLPAFRPGDALPDR